ncbi:MAG: ABC transporter permease [Desulfocurvibacter africanus]
MPGLRRIARLERIGRMAAQALWAYRLRSLFVVLGVGLGIASLTIIVAAVDGAQRKAREITENFGPDAAFVLGGDVLNRAVGMRTLTLSWTDLERIRQSLPGAYLVVPMRAKRNLKLRYGGTTIDLDSAIGSSANYAQAWDWPLAEGRDLNEEDVERGARVVLLGVVPTRELFGQRSPVGQTVYVNSIPFQVVGTLTERGASGGPGNPDERIVMPLTTLTQRFNLDRQYFRALRIKFRDPENMEANRENLRSFLRHLHGLGPGDPDDFTILTADEVLSFLSVIQGGLMVFLGVTSMVAMTVGGFVLANLFYLSVSERTREIGLKKAVGASSSAILLQFLTEAVLLTLVGALVGVALGMGAAQFLERLEILEIQLSWRIFGIALFASLGIGVLFGLRPARSAARLDPIEALRG